MEEESGVFPVAAGNTYMTTTSLPPDAVVAMAYVPYQTDKTRYDDGAALANGTLYPVLNKPFLRGACK